MAMLVLYDPCGCRVSALLDASDEKAAAEFITEARGDQTIRKEDRRDVAARTCAEHHEFMPCPDLSLDPADRGRHCKLVAGPHSSGHDILCHYGAPGEECGSYLSEHGAQAPERALLRFLSDVERACEALNKSADGQRYPNRARVVAGPIVRHVEQLRRAMSNAASVGLKTS